MKRVRECVYGGELDLLTLVWTRGRDFPLGMVESRLKCPRCGSRRVRVDDASAGKRRRERGRALIMANVRFTPESEHSLVAVQCPLSANKQHRTIAIKLKRPPTKAASRIKYSSSLRTY